jgi:hypothetical protein
MTAFCEIVSQIEDIWKQLTGKPDVPLEKHKKAV